MVREPDVQEKVRREIFAVLGKERRATLSDRERLPYTEATIMEIQRVGNVGPRGLPHATCLGPVQVGGGRYRIPRGHLILAIYKSLLQGDDHWEDGQRFNPDRFLNEEGKVVRDDHFIPFSTGKRICPGETLAKAELFLFLVGILQAFKLEPEDPRNPPPLEWRGGVTNVPVPFALRLIDCE